MGYRYRLLVDENVEHVESDLRTQGHDAEHVEQVRALGRGAADQADIVPYVQRSGRSPDSAGLTGVAHRNANIG